jgi:hypothetical protein
VLSGGDNIAAQTDLEMEKQSTLLFQLMGMIGTDVTAVQSVDLSKGMSTLTDLAQRYNVPQFCANLIDETGKPLLPGYKVFDLDGKRLGVLVITDPHMQHAATTMPKGIQFAEPDSILKVSVAKLRDEERCDAVVLLYGGRRDQALESCKAIPGIDLIFFGNATMSQRVPAETELGVQAYTAAAQGKDIGVLTLTMKDDGKVELSPIVIHELDGSYPDDPKIKELVDAYKAEVAERKRRDQLIQEMSEKFSETPVGETYLGSETCSRCHKDVFEAFKNTAHSHALDVLSKEGNETNPDCVVCHVTGWGKSGGYGLNPQNRDMLSHVQCEACHGYGTAHKRDGSDLAAARASCVACHNQEWSPDFNYAKYWKKIAH